jgi:hypothetical protein
MSNDILQGATNQFNFPELPNSKIILSEKCFIRLSGDINLCAFSGSKELEYGTFLYGKEIEPNVIYFDIPSEYDNYTPSYREFDVNTPEMIGEKEKHVNGTKYNCIAHIHTHPYIGGTCRFFSNQDLRTIKKLQLEHQPDDGRKKFFFGGLLTVSSENLPEKDEISFVFYDENHQKYYKLTNINVLMNKQEIPFNKVNNRPVMDLNESRITHR